MQEVIDDPKARQRLLDSGIEPIGGFGGGVCRGWCARLSFVGTVVRASGVKLD